MKISRVETLIELEEFFEKGVIGVPIPYFVQRLEYPDKIVWLGLNTNWKYEHQKWYKLTGSKFVECDIPEYEVEYLRLISQSDGNPA